MGNRYVFNAKNFESIKIPKIEEKRGKNWIDFGSNNLYPQLLLELYNNSAMHHTAIEAITDGVIGKGIKTWGDTPVNKYDETLNDILEKIVIDYEIFGGYSLNVIWSRDGENIAEIYHLPFQNVRSGLLDENEQVKEYWYSHDWAKHRKYKPKSYAPYSNTDNEGDNASQIFYYFDYSAGQFYYPLPHYVGAINDIDTDSRISRFHANNLKNGLNPSMMLTFKNGIPTPDEKREIWKDIDDTFGSEENAGKFFVTFAEPGREPSLEPVESANDDYYITLEKRVTSRILTAHRITSPLLLGIRDSNGFSSNADEIKTAYSHFMSTVILPDQKKIVKSLNRIFNKTGKTAKLEIEQSNILYDFGGKTEKEEQENVE